MNLSKTALRNITRNPRRSILSGCAIAVAAASIVFLFALHDGMKTDIAENIQTYYTGTIRIKHSEYEANKRLNPVHLTVENPDLIAQQIIKTVPDALISKRIVFPSRIYIGNAYNNALGIGVDFELEEDFMQISSMVTSGRLPLPEAREVLLGRGLAEKLKVKPGDSITILTSTASRGTNAFTLTVTGTASFRLPDFTNSVFMVPFDQTARLMRMENSAGEILVKLPGTSDKNAEAAAIELRKRLKDSRFENIDISLWKDISQSYSLIIMAEAFYHFLTLFFLMLGCTVIINTAMMVIYERIKETGTLMALGMKEKDIIKLFFLESFYLGIISSLCGVIIGAGISLVFHKTGINLGSSMEGIDIEISTILYPYPGIKYVITVFLYSAAVSSVSTFIPSLRAVRIKPVDALRHR